MQQNNTVTEPSWINRMQMHGFWMFCLFFLLSFLLFFITLSKPFLCDDYLVVHRVVMEQTIFIRGFFRPLSDISILLNYWVAGLNAFFFNLFNLAVHAGSCVLIYRFCVLAPFFPQGQKQFIGWASAIFFLVYPFHSESVVWMVGRASGLAGFFGFLSLVVVFSRIPLPWKYLLAPLFYFVGLAGYETIFPLPAIVLIFLYEKAKPLKTYLPWILGYGIALGIHLIVRYLVSGAIFGTYGERIFTPSSGYLQNALKVLGRLLLPPSDESGLLSILFVLLVLLFAGILFFFWKKRKQDLPVLIKLIAIVLVSCVIPIMFGLSTRTSEGDRLLYFASFFVTLLLAFGFSAIHNRITRWVVTLVMAGYFVFFLQQGNQNWKRAGVITRDIIAFVKNQQKGGRSMALINVPQEYNGALVFRNGLGEALLLQGVDTTGISVVRTLTTEEAREINNDIIPVRQTGGTFVPPNTLIYPDSVIRVVQPVSLDTAFINGKKISMLYYWNKRKMAALGK